MADLHTKTDLGEGCVPVGGQLRLLMIKPSLASWKVKVDFVVPELGIVTKGCLLRTKMKSVNSRTAVWRTTVENTNRGIKLVLESYSY